jgi:hypothetical protein
MVCLLRVWEPQMEWPTKYGTAKSLPVVPREAVSLREQRRTTSSGVLTAGYATYAGGGIRRVWLIRFYDSKT